MSSSCDCSTIRTTESSIPAEKNLTSFILLLCSIFAIVLGLVLLVCVIVLLLNRGIRKKARRMRPCTRELAIPTFLKIFEDHRVQKLLSCGVVVQCRDYIMEFGNNTKKEQTLHSVNWIQNIINQKFGTDDSGSPLIILPKDICMVCVPMNNFECGKSGCDFEPISGMAPGSYHSYQINGTERIQVTKYVEGGVEYVAGYCIYVDRPYDEALYYNQSHIDNCYLGPEYLPKKAKKVGGLELSEKSRIHESVREQIEVLKTLKTNFCKELKKPVLIGKDHGISVHFEWDDTLETFQTSECPSCKSDNLEDSPPSYYFLDI